MLPMLSFCSLIPWQFPSTSWRRVRSDLRQHWPHGGSVPRDVSQAESVWPCGPVWLWNWDLLVPGFDRTRHGTSKPPPERTWLPWQAQFSPRDLQQAKYSERGCQKEGKTQGGVAGQQQAMIEDCLESEYSSIQIDGHILFGRNFRLFQLVWFTQNWANCKVSKHTGHMLLAGCTRRGHESRSESAGGWRWVMMTDFRYLLWFCINSIKPW